MEIRRLDAFCKVVELKSFTRAAEVMLLSQPTISEHIRSLEEELDQKLLDRLGREVEVTPVGRVLYGYARKLCKLDRRLFRQSGNTAVSFLGGFYLVAGQFQGPIYSLS